MKGTILMICLAAVIQSGLMAQQTDTYWQQRAEYKMEIDMNVTTNQFTGTQELTYYNNSPDTLDRVFYHLYFNAFQPGSMMDVRSLTIEDPDRRVEDRISKLTPEEIGYHHILTLQQDGKDVSHKVSGTILEVWLNEPVLPGEKTVFDMTFESQVPLQIRRTGRDNAEGIEYSMSQWYPKLAEYDLRGWHANPYIGREFHGVWGDFDVEITIDPAYTVAATGVLQNPDKIGYGYQGAGKTVEQGTKPVTWNFVAENVHDFMWAADPDYTHDIAEVPGGPVLHFFYQKNDEYAESWSQLKEYMVKAVPFMNKTFGEYPYPSYSFVQGGDGGMEYPMATLITGNRNTRSLVGVAVHEMFHSWYQGVLATNESLYAWMDEGFTSFASSITMHYLFEPQNEGNPHNGSYRSYFAMASSGNEEPLTTHADMYHSNRSYGVNAYSKGAVFMAQLGYVIGQENMMKGLRRYYNEWKFRHPTDLDLIRIMEKVSGIELDWYLQNFVYTTNQIDYGIGSVRTSGGETLVELQRIGEMMMPVDLYVEYTDGTQEILYIPLRIMRGEKPVENEEISRLTMAAWPWTYPSYNVKIGRPLSEISRIVIDQTNRMADIDRSNNTFDNTIEIIPFSDPTR